MSDEVKDKEAAYKKLVKESALKKLVEKDATKLAKEKAPLPELVVTKLSSIKRQKPLRVFGGRLEQGAFSFIVGKGEIGKGVLSADIVARLTTGAPFPGDGGKWREPVPVMMCVVEDSKEQIHGRCEAAGADLDLVHLVEGQMVMRGGLAMPDPMKLSEDAGPLVTLAKKLGAGAIFLETVIEHLGGHDGIGKMSTHNLADVRSLLSPFRAVCKEANLFGWGLLHPRKGMGDDPHDNTSGSGAFRDVPRMVMQVFMDPSDESKNPARLLCCDKSNSMPMRPTTYRFHIESWEKDEYYPRCVWGVEGKTLEDDRTIEEIQQEIVDKKKVRKDLAVVNAEEFLRKLLASGQHPPDVIFAKAEEQGISEKTIKRAKKNLGLISVRDQAFHSKVLYWEFPKNEM
jgi:RecA-family ATPase